MNSDFWQGRKVFITGHTGFKGSWLSLLLNALGAQVTGYAQAPLTQPSLFQLAQISEQMDSIIGDLLDQERLKLALQQQQPEIIIHMAAQALVRQSYQDPVETFATNVQGTVHVLEAARQLPSVRAVIVVTSDKCYQNNEWPWGYRENDPMGGHDPYSASKGCAELVVAAYRASFFQQQGIQLASVRAGNVIGGGDWSTDRLIPDIIRAFQEGRELQIRNPQAVRPWQHVLDPLHGYLLLAQKLVTEGEAYAQGWNFGPLPKDTCSVGQVVEKMAALWQQPTRWTVTADPTKHEAHTLRLDSSLAQAQLTWQPILPLDEALAWTVEWYRAHAEKEANMQAFSYKQIKAFIERVNAS